MVMCPSSRALLASWNSLELAAYSCGYNLARFIMQDLEENRKRWNQFSQNKNNLINKIVFYIPHKFLVHGHVKITFNSILSHVTPLDVSWISFSSFHVSRISHILHYMDTLQSLLTHSIPSSLHVSRINCNFAFMVEHIMLLKFPSRYHMVFGILCTLTVLIFEQHRTQLRFRPRTSTCFRQC